MKYEPIPAFRFLTAKPLGFYRFRAAFGGRGAAKSWEFADAAIFHAVTIPKLRVIFLREIMANLKESSLELVRNRLEHYGLLNTYFREVDGSFVGRGGQKILFIGLWKGNKPEGIKSLEGAGLTILEEAQEVRQASLDVLLPTILRTSISELWAIWNPRLATDPIDVFFRGEVKPRRAIVRKINFEQNPFFPEALRELMELDFRKDPGRASWIWHGGYLTNSETRVFKNWEKREFDTPADAVLRFGADWGFAVDPCVLIRMFIGRLVNGMAVADQTGRTLFIDQEAYKVGCEIDETPALFAGDCPASMADENGKPRWANTHKHPGVPGALKWLITADSARPETVSYMKRKGFRIVPAIKGPGSVEDGVEFLRSFDIVVHPRCPHTIEELTLYSWKTDPQTSEVLPVLADKDNHLIDAARYGLEGVRRARVIKKPDLADQAQRTVRKDYRRMEPDGGSGWMEA